MNPSTKNPVVLYPRFTKLIIDHILTTHHDILKRLNEPNHLAAHDDVVHSIFAYGNSKGQGMGIPNYLLIAKFMQTEAYKVYVADFMLYPEEEEGERIWELSVAKNSFKITIKRRQIDPEAPIPTAKHIDLDNMNEAQQLSYTLAKSAKEAEAQENVKLVEQHLLNKDVNKIAEGGDSTAVEFSDSVEDFLRNYMNNTVFNVYPSLCSSIPGMQYQLYLKMKNDPESQVDDFDLWDALKDKFQKSLPPPNTCRPEASQKRDHDDHSDDHPEG
ncbi:hypothetical protein Tco_0217235 [Tanacetum coccineum]